MHWWWPGPIPIQIQLRFIILRRMKCFHILLVKWTFSHFVPSPEPVSFSALTQHLNPIILISFVKSYWCICKWSASWSGFPQVNERTLELDLPPGHAVLSHQPERAHVRENRCEHTVGQTNKWSKLWGCGMLERLWERVDDRIHHHQQTQGSSIAHEGPTMTVSLRVSRELWTIGLFPDQVSSSLNIWLWHKRNLKVILRKKLNNVS